MSANDRLTELLADAALGLLDRDEQTELDRLLDGRAPEEASDAEWLVADLLARQIEREESPLPEDLRARLLEEARPFHQAAPRAETETTASVTPLFQIAPWIGFAAAAALAVFFLRPTTGGFIAPQPTTQETRAPASASASASTPAPAPAPAAQMQIRLDRERLLAEADDLVLLDWQATEDPTAAKGLWGNVLWSPSRQEGYMRFSGLAANDPAEFQYQLWIFDAERDERYPVDGGVFDIPETGTGEDIIVAIEPRLPVSEATLFAVTVEKPGGVVVSSRERITVLAQPSRSG